MKAHLLLLVLLAGCGPLVQIGGNAPVPASLLTLSATTKPAAYAGPVPASVSASNRWTCRLGCSAQAAPVR